MFQLSRTAFTILMSYIAGGWTLIEFSSFLFDRFYISTTWVDIFILILLTMSPTIIVVAFISEKKKFKRAFIPINSIVTIITCLFLFMGKPLGTYATSTRFINELGESESFVSLKDQLRKRIVIADFSLEFDTARWLSPGMRILVSDDLTATDMLDIPKDFYAHSDDNLSEVFENAGDYMDYFLKGRISNKNDNYEISLELRNKQGSILFQDTTTQATVFELVDYVSEMIIRYIELPDFVSVEIRDYPLASITTSNRNSLVHYVESFHFNLNSNNRIQQLWKSLELDPTFVQAAVSLADNIGSIGQDYYSQISSDILKNVLPYRKKLSSTSQLELLIEYYKYTDPSKAVELCSNLLDLHPNNYKKTKTVANIYRMSDSTFRDYRDYMFSVYDQLRNDERHSFLTESTFYADELIAAKIQEEYSNDPLNPRWIDSKIYHHYSTGNIDSTREYLERFKLIQPEKSDSIDVINKNLENFNLVDLTGEYRSSVGRYIRSYVSNQYGIQYAVYSPLYNNRSPVFFISERKFFEVPGYEQGIFYNSRGDIFALSHYFGYNYYEAYKLSDQIRQLETSIIKMDYDLAREILSTMENDHPGLIFVDNYKEHIEYAASGGKLDDSYLGEYETLSVLRIDSKTLVVNKDRPWDTVNLLASSPSKAYQLERSSIFFEFNTDWDSAEIWMHVWKQYPYGQEIGYGNRIINKLPQ